MHALIVMLQESGDKGGGCAENGADTPADAAIGEGLSAFAIEGDGAETGRTAQ